jgi:predicted CoA-binding protein
MTDTAEITLHGLKLEVEFSYEPAERGITDSKGAPETPSFGEEIDIVEIYHHGEEVLCIMDDNSISKARDLVLAQKGE